MVLRILSLLSVFLVPLTAASEIQWADALDIDFSYRNSARLEANRTWDFRLGAGIEYEPTYQGSDRSDSEVDPFVIAAYRADWGNVFLTGGGVGFSRMLSKQIGIFVQLEMEDVREIDDDQRLAGLGNQDEELELEIVGKYFMGPLTLGISVAPATGDKGVVWFAGADYHWRLADERLFLSLGADLSGSSKDNQQTDFGITPAQSLASGYREYSPDGGLKSLGLSFAAEYEVNRQWYLYAQADYERLLGDVADSPIVFDENNVEVGLGVFYRF
ncbi:MAG: MipA/OmpV family protein [Pseudomonadota bacterium]